MIKKILTIASIRPDFIRLSELIKLLDKNKNFEHILLHTGQHFDYEMDKIFFDQLGIRHPDINLGMGKELSSGGNRSDHNYQTAFLNINLTEWMDKLKPDITVILGDSNLVTVTPTLAKNGHKIAHIEAGMRAFSFETPEEINRKVIDHCSYRLYHYLENYARNLILEGIPSHKIKTVGNIIVDALYQFGHKAQKPNTLHNWIKSDEFIAQPVKLEPQKFIFATIHRHENTSNLTRLNNIITNIESFAKRSAKMPVYLVLIPSAIRQFKKLGIIKLETVNIIKPLGYLEALWMEKNARLIIHDSGSVQEEAFVLGTPCLTMRNSTERPETVEAGGTCLISPDDDESVYSMEWAVKIGMKKEWDRTLLGDGHTSMRICYDLVECLENPAINMNNYMYSPQQFARARTQSYLGGDINESL